MRGLIVMLNSPLIKEVVAVNLVVIVFISDEMKKNVIGSRVIRIRKEIRDDRAPQFHIHF